MVTFAGGNGSRLQGLHAISLPDTANQPTPTFIGTKHGGARHRILLHRSHGSRQHTMCRMDESGMPVGGAMADRRFSVEAARAVRARSAVRWGTAGPF